MLTNVDNMAPNGLFEEEIEKAVEWLKGIQDPEKKGWGWLQHIPPGAQNTSEAILALLDAGEPVDSDYILAAVESFILNLGSNTRITRNYAWICFALIEVRNKLYELEDSTTHEKLLSNIDQAIETCVKWLKENQSKEGCWGDKKGLDCYVYKTSIALRALIKACSLCDEVEKGKDWLLKHQNNDGGWGSAPGGISSESEGEMSKDLVKKLKTQINSNPGSTAHAILALLEYPSGAIKFRKEIKRGIRWLLRDQDPLTGSWKVFRETGIKDSRWYTFRHFSTAWAITAIVKSGERDFEDTNILSALSYLLKQQDEEVGGWRTSEETYPFVWATHNAIHALKVAEDSAKEIKPDRLLMILREWKRLRLEKEVETMRLLRWSISFNKHMSSLFSIMFSFGALIIVALLCLLISHKTIMSIVLAIGFLIIGVVWTCHFYYNVYEKDWKKSFSFVYAIIGLIIGISLSIIALT